MYYIYKNRIYIKNPSDAPEGVKVQEGKRGGLYYESSTQPQSSEREQSTLKIPKTRDEFEQYSEKIETELKSYLKPNDYSNIIWMMSDWIGAEAISNLAIRDLVANYYGYNNDLDAYEKSFNSHGFGFLASKQMISMLVNTIWQGIDPKTHQPMTEEQVRDVKIQKLNSLLAQKDFTKKKTEEIFGKQIEVYRGINKDEFQKIKLNGYKYNEMALSSYTMNKNVAKAFAGNNGAVIKKIVKSDDIWFAWYSNSSMTYYENPQSKLPELEVVVGNPQSKHQVKPEDIEEII